MLKVDDLFVFNIVVGIGKLYEKYYNSVIGNLHCLVNK